MKMKIMMTILLAGLICMGCGAKPETGSPGTNIATTQRDNQTVTVSPTTFEPAETPAKAAPLGEADLSLGKILLGTSLEDYKKVVPQDPSAVVMENDAELELEKKTLQYEGFTVILLNDTVYSAETTQGTFATSRGLKVGDGSEVVVSKYGEPHSKNGDEWAYLYNDEYSVFFVTVQGGKVVKIRVSQVM